MLFSVDIYMMVIRECHVLPLLLVLFKLSVLSFHQIKPNQSTNLHYKMPSILLKVYAIYFLFILIPPENTEFFGSFSLLLKKR